MKTNKDGYDWRLEGDYFDGCNCKSICPCIFGLDPSGVKGYDVYIGLGWFTTTNFGSQIIWHNGGVLGYNAFAGFNPTTQRGVVILASTGVQDIPVANVGFGPHDKLSTMIWDLLLN